jgi:hypothetical protein
LETFCRELGAKSGDAIVARSSASDLDIVRLAFGAFVAWVVKLLFPTVVTLKIVLVENSSVDEEKVSIASPVDLGSMPSLVVVVSTRSLEVTLQ